jgi:membrane protein
VFSVAKTERATRPSSPFRLSLGSWRSAFKGAGKEFLADDCLGLAQQVAFSSLLAFFPSVILVVGLLGLLGSGAYDSLINLLGTVAPKGVLSALELAKKSSADNHAGSAIALTIGVVGALWAASGATASIVKAVNRAYDLEESRPFWRVRLIALGLVALTGIVTAAVFVLIVFGAPLGDAIVLLLWLYYSALALLAGAELNAELERRGRAR